jgi:histone-lysine N-methyltransferase SETMAR
MLTLFWDERGVILEHYMPRGNTVNSAAYADLLKNHLRPAIKSKQRGLLSTGVLLQHDNARPHTAHSIVATIQDLSFECLPHPPYSPDLTPSDFHVFGPLKEAMVGKSFRSNKSRRCMNGCAVSPRVRTRTREALADQSWVRTVKPAIGR